jgi:hypothetical protein
MGRLARGRHFIRSVLPKSRKGAAALWAGLFVVVGAALLVPTLHAATASGVMAIPSPPAVTFGAEMGQSASGPESVRPTLARLSPSTRVSPSDSSSPRAVSSRTASPSAASAVPADDGDGATNSPGSTASKQAAGSLPVAGTSYAGSLLMDETGSQVEAWNPGSASYCRDDSWMVADGSVSTDSSGDALLETTGHQGSCVGLVSPAAYSSAVIEAHVYFPPLLGKSGTIANWSAFWLTDQSAWPEDGELDAVEAFPVTGVNTVTYHWGSPSSPESISTSGSPQGTTPIDGPNITSGWHVVDIVYTKGFFAVYYDGKEYTSLSSDVITGSAVNILITATVTPDSSAAEQQVGGTPVNSDSSPAGLAVQYVKVWSFK